MTRRGAALAGSAALLTYSILLSAFLCLTTTPPEATVAALRWLLGPLRVLRVDVDEVALLVLLSLRFLSLARAPAAPPGLYYYRPSAFAHNPPGPRLTAVPVLRPSQVFEEIRNLALGVAVRGVDWQVRTVHAQRSERGRRRWDTLSHASLGCFVFCAGPRRPWAGVCGRGPVLAALQEFLHERRADRRGDGGAHLRRLSRDPGRGPCVM